MTPPKPPSHRAARAHHDHLNAEMRGNLEQALCLLREQGYDMIDADERPYPIYATLSRADPFVIRGLAAAAMAMLLNHTSTS